MYYERYKANIEIFNDVPKIDLGGVVLRSLIPNKIEVEAQVYLQISKSNLVRQFLPNAYVSTEAEAMDKMRYFVEAFLLKQGFLFCIAIKETNVPIGYVLCNSPLQVYSDGKTPIGDWTVNYWIAEYASGKGITDVALHNTLRYLKQMEVPRVFAFVDKTNERGIKLLDKSIMKFIDATSMQNMYKYGITF